MSIVKNISEKAFQLTNRIIDETGPRLAGTEASLLAAELLTEELSKFSDVHQEEFTLHKGAFLGWIKILVASYLLGVVSLWLGYPIVSVGLLLLSILILVFQFFLYKHFIDFLYPKRKGKNVVGIIEPEGEVKRQVIISGHHDSARIFNFFIHQPSLYNVRVTGGITLIIVLFLLSIASLVIESTPVLLAINITMSLGFLLTGQMWFFASNKGTPGAGDNLIASALAVEIARHYSIKRCKHTRIIALSFDAEEEGLRGARAYAEKHKNEFDKLETILLNVDCPYYEKDLFFLTSDINGSVKLSTELAEDLVDIAQEKLFPAKHQPIAFLTGGTDAGELAKYNVKATTLMAMPWSNNERAAVYHTPNDTTDNIEPKAIENTIDIFMTYIERTDK